MIEHPRGDGTANYDGDDVPDDVFHADSEDAADDAAHERCTCPITTTVLGYHEDDCPAAEYFAEREEAQRLDEERRAENRKPIKRHWIERATDFDGGPHNGGRRSLPRPGDVVRTSVLSSSDINGHHFRGTTGTVLWADAVNHVTETTYRDDDGNTTSVHTARTPQLHIQFRDGRDVTLNAHTLEGVWQVLTDTEVDEMRSIADRSTQMLIDADALTGHAKRALRAAANDLYASTGLAEPARVNCFPAIERGPKRPSLTWLLGQDEQWWPFERPPIALTDMGPRHRRHLFDWLRRRASRMHSADVWSLHNAPDDVFNSAMREDAGEWMDRRPLVRKLRALIAADEAAEAPDEAPPSEDDLARWRRGSGRAADGSEDDLPEAELFRRRRVMDGGTAPETEPLPEFADPTARTGGTTR